MNKIRTGIFTIILLIFSSCSSAAIVSPIERLEIELENSLQIQEEVYTPSIWEYLDKRALEASEYEYEISYFTEVTHPCWRGYGLGFDHVATDDAHICLECGKYAHPCFKMGYEGYYTYIHTEPEKGHCKRCGDLLELRYGFTEADVLLLTQLLVGDQSRYGDGEMDFTWWLHNDNLHDGKILEINKVLNVVMNRVRTYRYNFPNTVREVVLAPGQFVVFPQNLSANPCPMAIEVIREWTERYDRWCPSAQMIPEDHLFFWEGPNITNITRRNYR